MTAPGWHPDPTRPGQLRYWDGTAWTAATAPAPATAPAGWHPDPDPAAPAGQLRHWDGTAWTAQIRSGHRHLEHGPAATFDGITRDPQPEPVRHPFEIPQDRDELLAGEVENLGPLGRKLARALLKGSDRPDPEDILRRARTAHGTTPPAPPAELTARTGSRRGGQLLYAWLFLNSAVFAVLSAAAPPSEGGDGLLWSIAGIWAAYAAWAMRRHWKLADTPTSSLGGLRPGRVEVTGQLCPAGHIFDTPISNGTVLSGTVKSTRGTGDDKTVEFNTRFGTSWVAIQDGQYRAVLPGWAATLTRKTATVTDPAEPAREIAETGVLAGPTVTVHARIRANAAGVLTFAPPRAGDFAVYGNAHEAEADARRHVRAALAGMGALTLMTAVAAALHSTDGAFGAAVARGGSITALFAAVFAGAHLWRLHNRIVAADEQAAESWSWTLLELRRRHDLIANLAATVAAAYRHETATLVDTALARLNDGTVPDRASRDAVNTIDAADTTAAGRLRALVEAAPQLRAGTAATGLLVALAATEDRIASARRFYNDAVTVHRNLTATFPGVLLTPVVPPPGELLDSNGGQPSPPAADPDAANTTPS